MHEAQAGQAAWMQQINIIEVPSAALV